MQKNETNKKIDENSLKNQFLKRNFYTAKDSANVYLYALLIPLAISLIVAYCLVLYIQKSGFEVGEGENAVDVLVNKFIWLAILLTVLNQVIFISIYLVYNKVGRIQQKSCNLSFKKANIWTSLLSMLFGIVFVLGFVLLIECCLGALFTKWNIKGGTSYLPLDNVGWLFVNLLLMGVLPAVSEELIFRGIVFQGLKEKFSPVWNVLLNGLLFALIHQNITQFVYPFILGCVLSLLMQRTNNLLYSILLHCFNNFTTIILSFLAEKGIINFGFNITWWIVLIAIAVAGVTIVLAWLVDKFYLRKRKPVEIKNEGELNQSPPIMVWKFPLTLIISVVLAIIFIVLNAVM